MAEPSLHAPCRSGRKDDPSTKCVSFHEHKVYGYSSLGLHFLR
ncbi:Uncharacterised protein [Vibrio cholerae]|nr:Uncharacterised protein [Vibrio cholerae]